MLQNDDLMICDRTSKPEALSFFQKAKVILFGVNIPRPTGKHSPSDLAEEAKVLTINSQKGITLEAWYCDLGGTKPLVILFHGYSAEKTSLLPEAHALLEMGTSVMLVDFRGSGGSSETYTTIGVRESDDVAAVVRFAKENLSHSGTVLFGQSMGAVAILKAIQNHGIQPDAVILEAVFDTMLNTVQNRFHAMRIPSFPSAELLVFWGGRQWGFDGFRHNPIDYASSVNCPALFMHGRDDPRATLEDGRRVFDAVAGTKEFVMFEKTGHESYFTTHPTEWRNAVEEIIRRAGNKASHCTADSETRNMDEQQCSFKPTSVWHAGTTLETPRPQRVWRNSIATYTDTDGDGKVDRWERGDAVYTDEDRDGNIDRMIENRHEWDGIGPIYNTDGDRYFDSSYVDGQLQEMDRRVLVPSFPDPSPNVR